MSFFAGSTALLFVAKLHGVNYAASLSYSLVASQILAPFFEVSGLSSLSINALLLCFVALGVVTMGAWAYNLIIEANQGHHTLRVQLAFKYGMLLFLVSEAMLFFPFFWSFFHGAFSPSINIGGVWPPIGIKDIEVLDPSMLPLVNTAVLLCSGVAIVSAHRGILFGNESVLINMMYLAISFGIFFSWLQFVEYGLTSFTINDGLYGSSFFMLTGLHGFHVIVGTTLLTIAYVRAVNRDFSTEHHIGF
jgi:heme/copper-type cytochrome/quinol oxidase subunit 3